MSKVSVPLNSNEVHIWCCSSEQRFTPAQIQQYRDILHSEELDKVDRYKFKRDRIQSLLSRAMIRNACSYYLGSGPPQSWQFKSGEKGKPYLATTHQTPFHFNLSHTRGLILLAVSPRHELGIDVEHITRNSDSNAIAERYFSTREVAALRRLEPRTQHYHFFDYWTLKESYIKACGLGLAIPLCDFSFDIKRPPSTTHNQPSYAINSDIDIQFHNGRQDRNEHWQSFLFDLSCDHRGALSVHTKTATTPPLTLSFFECIPLRQLSPCSLPLI